MDLGECPKLHDLALRADYEAAAMQKDYFYDVDVSSIIITSILINSLPKSENLNIINMSQFTF